jgi:CreA protein
MSFNLLSCSRAGWLLMGLVACPAVRAQTIGAVDTCYLSRAKTGGIKGAFGLAEDKAEASIACRQVGPIAFTGPLPRQAEVFNERMSVLFKRLRVVRMVDPKRNALVYLTYSDRLIDGSPQNSVTAVPVNAATPIPMK